MIRMTMIMMMLLMMMILFVRLTTVPHHAAESCSKLKNAYARTRKRWPSKADNSSASCGRVRSYAHAVHWHRTTALYSCRVTCHRRGGGVQCRKRGTSPIGLTKIDYISIPNFASIALTTNTNMGLFGKRWVSAWTKEEDCISLDLVRLHLHFFALHISGLHLIVVHCLALHPLALHSFSFACLAFLCVEIS